MPEQDKGQEQPQDVILNDAGNPFASEEQTLFFMKKKGWLECAEVVLHETGFGIVMTGEPVAETEAAAAQKPAGEHKPKPKPRKRAKARKKPKKTVVKKPAAPTAPVTETATEPDPEPVGDDLKVMCPLCGHKAPAATTPDHTRCTEETVQDGHKQQCPGYYGADSSIKTYTYHIVVFGQRKDKFDTEKAQLYCNGTCLLIERMKPVCIRSDFKSVADTALQNLFEQLPNKARKDFAPVATYPYTEVGPGTEEEFENQRRDGTQQTRRELEMDAAAVSASTRSSAAA